MMAKFTVELLHPIKVPKLPAGPIQIQAVCHPGDTNVGVHVQLYALCEDGSIWCKYDSSGYSNVPTDGYWYNANLDVTPKEIKDRPINIPGPDATLVVAADEADTNAND